MVTALNVVDYAQKRNRLLESLDRMAYRNYQHRSTAQTFADLNERRAARGLPPIIPEPEHKPEKP